VSDKVTTPLSSSRKKRVSASKAGGDKGAGHDGSPARGHCTEYPMLWKARGERGGKTYQPFRNWGKNLCWEGGPEEAAAIHNGFVKVHYAGD